MSGAQILPNWIWQFYLGMAKLPVTLSHSNHLKVFLKQFCPPQVSAPGRGRDGKWKITWTITLTQTKNQLTKRKLKYTQNRRFGINFEIQQWSVKHPKLLCPALQTLPSACENKNMQNVSTVVLAEHGSFINSKSNKIESWFLRRGERVPGQKLLRVE